MIVAEHFDRELLTESIRFNAHFLELCLKCDIDDQSIINQIDDLKELLSLWKTRDYPPNSDIDYASALLELFHDVHHT